MIKYNLTTLPNKIKFIYAPLTTSEAVTTFILVGTGGRFEKSQQSGISHFLEHLFFKGSKNRPSAFEISKELDGIGANYNAFTGEEYTGFYVQSSAQDFDRSFDVLTDMFLNPLFTSDEIEREKGVIMQELNMYRDMPQLYVQILNQNQIFKNHPLGYDLIGNQETISAIGQKEIIDYRAKHYTNSNTTVVVCGKENDKYNEKIFNTFGHLEDSPAPKFNEFSSEKVEDKLIQEIRKVDQTHLVLSYLGIAKTDKRKYTLTVLNTILGGGMSSRLFTQIRERRGLAYYVRSSVSAFHDTGAISLIAGVKTDKVSETIKVMLQEVADLATKGPSAEELERAKGNLRGSLLLGLEDSFEIASFLADELLYQGKIREIEEIIKAINSVTQEEIVDLAKFIFQKEKMGLAIVGPKDYNDILKEQLN